MSRTTSVTPRFRSHSSSRDAETAGCGPAKSQLGMVMHLIAWFLAMLVASTTCLAAPDRATSNENVSLTNEFLPIEPEVAGSTVEVVVGGTVVKTDIRLLSDEEQLKFLTTSRSSTRIAKVGINGKLSFLTGTFTAERGRYAVFMDHANYFVEPKVVNEKYVGRQKTGIGLRLVANITTNKRGLDLGSIFKIGLAVGRNEMSGSLEVLAFGVNGPQIAPLLPGIMPTIDEGSIQKALESMAAVRAKFWEDDTSISPSHFAIETFETDTVDPPQFPRIDSSGEADVEAM